jgi:hypothetical protein
MPKLARIIFVILLAAGCRSQLRADTISVFTISGTDISSCLLVGPGTPIPGCTPTSGEFAGVLEVDATTGAAIAMDILSTNFGEFRNIWPGIDFNFRPGLIGNCLAQGSPIAEVLYLCITTPTPGSLLGFERSTIIGWPNAGSFVLDNSNVPLFYILGGSIMPVLQTPEPSPFALILIGLGCLLVMRKRMGGARNPHPLLRHHARFWLLSNQLDSPEASQTFGPNGWADRESGSRRPEKMWSPAPTVPATIESKAWSFL